MNKDGILMAVSLKNKSCRIDEDWYYVGATLFERVTKTPKGTNVSYDFTAEGSKRILSWFEVKAPTKALTDYIGEEPIYPILQAAGAD